MQDHEKGKREKKKYKMSVKRKYEKPTSFLLSISPQA